MERTLNVNGFEIKAKYSEKEIQTLFLPLLEMIADKKAKTNDRLIVYLAAPPGTGKTTLSIFLEKLYTEQCFPFSFQAISIDGFHYRRSYLLSHYITIENQKVLLNDIKGSPESFDIDALNRAIRTMRKEKIDWPLYDRTKHDVADKKITVSADIVLIEGNWLLLKEDGWEDLIDYCDLSIYIDAQEEILRDRLIERKRKGGLSLLEAENFYENSDKKNIFRVLQNHHIPDIRLYLSDKEEFERG